MRKHVLFLLFLVFANMGNPIQAQGEGDVKISYENGDNGSYKFYCENRLYCKCVVEINFTRLDVPLVFYTQEEKAKMLTMNKEYTCEKPESIIIQEMSKSELKNWRKKNPSSTGLQ